MISKYDRFSGLYYKCWIKDGFLMHREDGPAIEYYDGSREWCIDGYRHRIDGPAVEQPNGYKAWYINGKLHRENGPAVEHPDGTKQYWLNGINISSLKTLLLCYPDNKTINLV